MSDVINSITSSTIGITHTTLWNDLLLLIPFILILFTFSFGYYKIRHFINVRSWEYMNGYRDKHGRYTKKYYNELN